MVAATRSFHQYVIGSGQHLTTTPKKYNLIYADPPWLYNDARTHKSTGMARSAYECMSTQSICDLPVRGLADDDCMLALWATMPKLPEALKVIEAWGFKYITCGFVWIKAIPSWNSNDMRIAMWDIYSGLGHWVNGNAELVLLGRKGSPARMAYDVKQVVVAPRGAHSVKPEEVRRRLEKLFGDVLRVELFARLRTEGWDAIGNGIDGQDIRQALEQYKCRQQ